MAVRLTTLDLQTPAIDTKVGTFMGRWQELIRGLFTDVAAVASLPAVINRGTSTELNALGLGASDESYLAFETVTGHVLRWTGTAWTFAAGDVGNKFKRDFWGTPQEDGWVLCDGGASSYLQLGATLSLTAFTTPNLSGSPAFHKSIAAYTGTIEAAIAPALSGSTANATATVSGSTANESAHTHGGGSLSGSTASEGTGNTGLSNNPTVEADINRDGNTFYLTADHTHDGPSHAHGVGTLAVGTSGAGSAHGHGAGTLAVDNHLHALGTLAADSAARPPSIGWLPYFRR